MEFKLAGAVGAIAQMSGAALGQVGQVRSSVQKTAPWRGALAKSEWVHLPVVTGAAGNWIACSCCVESSSSLFAMQCCYEFHVVAASALIVDSCRLWQMLLMFKDYTKKREA